VHYLLALPEMEMIEILKIFVLSLRFSMYSSPSGIKPAEYL